MLGSLGKGMWFKLNMHLLHTGKLHLTLHILFKFDMNKSFTSIHMWSFRSDTIALTQRCETPAALTKRQHFTLCLTGGSCPRLTMAAAFSRIQRIARYNLLVSEGISQNFIIHWKHFSFAFFSLCFDIHTQNSSTGMTHSTHSPITQCKHRWSFVV